MTGSTEERTTPKGSSDEVRKAVESYRHEVDILKKEINKVIVGHAEIINGVITCLLAGGHALIEGVPGLGKTMLVRTLAQTLSLDFCRIQFTPDLMPADIIGTNVIAEDDQGRKGFSFQRGPIFAHIILADEINRATPKTQSALLEAMQEKSVTVSRHTHILEEPFLVLATQNPLEMEGTYPLPEAQLDRFLQKLLVQFPKREDLHQIVQRTTGEKTPEAQAVMAPDTLLRLRSLVREVLVAQHVLDYAVRIVLATHPESAQATPATKRFVRYGSSPRGAQALLLSAKVQALSNGRYNASMEDIRAIAKPCLRHRIILNFEGEAEGVSTDKVLDEILEKTPEKM